jgi:hypothetical protein
VDKDKHIYSLTELTELRRQPGKVSNQKVLLRTNSSSIRSHDDSPVALVIFVLLKFIVTHQPSTTKTKHTREWWMGQEQRNRVWREEKGTSYWQRFCCIREFGLTFGLISLMQVLDWIASKSEYSEFLTHPTKRCWFFKNNYQEIIDEIRWREVFLSQAVVHLIIISPDPNRQPLFLVLYTASLKMTARRTDANSIIQPESTVETVLPVPKMDVGSITRIPTKWTSR